MPICDDCGEEFDDDSLEAEFGFDDGEECLCAFCNSEPAADGRYED